MNRWPQDRAYSWEKYPFLRILIPFVAGIVAYYLTDLSKLPFGHSIAALIMGIAAYSVIFLLKKNNTFSTVASFLAFITTLFFAGVSLSHINDIRNDVKWFGHNINAKARYAVLLSAQPVQKENGWKLPVELISIVNDGKAQPVTGRAFIYVSRSTIPLPFHQGDTLLTPGKWKAITNAGNPFEYDYAGHCAYNNIYHRQTCMPWDICRYGVANKSAQSLTDRFHTACISQLDKYLTDKKTKGLIQAMLLGDEVNLDENQRQAYSETGIIHIVAISGSHVMGFVWLISLLLFFIRHKKYYWVKLCVALPLVWFYVFAAGSPPSAVRAAVMFSLLAVSVVLEKNNSSINTLFASAFVLLCADPGWLFSVGFQLSFVAVLSLAIFYAPISGLLYPKNRVLRWLWNAAALSIAAEILVAPLVIYYFHTFPVTFVVANIVAGVFMGALTLLSLGIITFSFIPIVAGFVASVSVFLVTTFDRLIARMQGFNPTSFLFLQASGLELILTYAAIAAFALAFFKKRRQPMFAGLALACVLVACLCYDDWHNLQQRRVVVYNTGRTGHVEAIAGNHFAILHTDTTSAKRASYATGAAHKGMQAWLQYGHPEKILTINNKRILVLNDYLLQGRHFPVDYLIVALPGIPDISKLNEIFSPSIVILTNRISAKQLDYLREQCAQRHITLHIPARDGSFVIADK